MRTAHVPRAGRIPVRTHAERALGAADVLPFAGPQVAEAVRAVQWPGVVAEELVGWGAAGADLIEVFYAFFIAWRDGDAHVFVVSIDPVLAAVLGVGAVGETKD